LFDPDFEVSGCYLVPNDEARARIDADHIKYSSQSNGRGPHAWNHHWLLVPLYERNGEAMGFIWADDPEDRLVPSAERLHALRATIRSGDNAFRIGGDEFAVIVPEATERDAHAAAQRIADELQLAASFGVAICEQDCDAGTLLREADGAMYRMKRRRRSGAL